YGRASHQLSGANGIIQSDYVDLKIRFPAIPMAPIIHGHVAIGAELFSLLGLDPFAEAEFDRMRGDDPSTTNVQTGSEDSATEPSSLQNLLSPSALFVSRVSAEQSSLEVGETLALNVAGRSVSATVAGTFSSDNPVAATGLLIGDIAFVQDALQRNNKIDRIDLILSEDQVAAVEDALPDSLRLSSSASRQQTMQAMTRGFHINLTAMSLLALVVGAFLIHNTMTFAVVQRRELFAIKRITGISSRTVLLSILAEAIAISLVAAVVGIALGFALAKALIQLTTQTINDLYFVLHVQEIWFSPWLIAGGIALGVGSSVVAASLSAFEAASTSPVQARQRSLLEERTHSSLPRIAMVGVIAMLAGFALAVLPAQSLLLGFGALMLVILGYGLTLPWAVLKISQLIKPLAQRMGINLSLAVGGIERNISRTGLAIAALTIAVSATFGVDIMIGSFRATVDNWLGTTLQSDVYISAPSAASTQQSAMLAEDSAMLARAIPGVRSVSTGRSIEVATSVGSIDMLVVEPHENSDSGFELIDGDARQAWPLWRSSDSIMISEPLATKHKLGQGDTLNLFTEQAGYKAFPIAAVFRDFGSSHGKLLMSRQVFSQHWRDDRISTLGILLNNVQDDEKIIVALKNKLASTEHPLLIQSNTAIHRQSLTVFDRTFEVTQVLRWLTVAVAFVGIFSALLALHLERAREFAILRASGATRLRLMGIVFSQTFIMGALAGLLALPLGWAMSELLVKVINVRSFGWSMESILPTGSITAALGLACLSAVLAGLYPAGKLSRTQIAQQLRDDT
ncbi:MAG: FtsX-like permease family protein, partial [Granulosicoccus sp.]